MKTLIALSLVSLMAAPTFIPPAVAAPMLRDVAGQSHLTLGGGYDSGVDLTQSGPIHRGPLYRGYPLSDWYIY
jgi:hypothetical protein